MDPLHPIVPVSPQPAAVASTAPVRRTAGRPERDGERQGPPGRGDGRRQDFANAEDPHRQPVPGRPLRPGDPPAAADDGRVDITA